MRRREAIVLILNAVGLPHHAFAQERTKIARVGYLGPAPVENFARRVEALRAGLRDLGYVEGTNLSFEFRWANAPDELPELAAELICARVDVIVVPSSTETAAVLKTTQQRPRRFHSTCRPH